MQRCLETCVTPKDDHRHDSVRTAPASIMWPPPSGAGSPSPVWTLQKMFSSLKYPARYRECGNQAHRSDEANT